MFVVVWQFEIAEDKVAGFEAAYGPEGAWAQLFRTSPEYHGTELLRDAYVPGNYLTIDRWTSEEAFRAFRKEHDSEYEVAGPRVRRAHRPARRGWARTRFDLRRRRYSRTSRLLAELGPAIYLSPRSKVTSTPFSLIASPADMRLSPVDGRRCALRSER